MIDMADTHLTEAEVQAAVRVLRSGALRQGSECAAFEEEFARLVGARYAVSCANGSAALHLAYAGLLEPGDEVLVPTFTFFATASMAIQAGLKPVLCDVEPDTFLIDLEDAENRLSSRTRAIAPVHLFGNPCHVGRVLAFAAEHGLKIIWDAAQAHGATWNSEDVGRFGDAVCYSFYPTKNLFVGEGGMVTTQEEDLAYRLRYLRTHGQTAKYTHTMIGWNYRMTDVEAAIGRAQLARFQDMLATRRRNAGILRVGLRDLEGLGLQKLSSSEDEHAWHQFCFTIDAAHFGCGRDVLKECLARQGIASAVHYPRCVHEQPVIEKLYGEQVLATGERLTRSILAIPVHHSVTESEVERIVQVIRDSAGSKL